MRVDQARGALFVIFLISLELSSYHFAVRRPGNGVVSQTVLLMSESADVSDPLIDAAVNEFLNDAHPDRVELQERQRAVEERCVGSRLPQVDSVDDFVLMTQNRCIASLSAI